MRVLDQNGTREVGAEKVALAQALEPAVRVVAETHLHLKEVLPDIRQLGALVDKADERLLQKVAGIDHVGGQAGLVLKLHIKAVQIHSHRDIAVPVADLPAEHLKGIARQQRDLARDADIPVELRGMVAKILQHHAQVPLGARADVHKIILREVHRIAEGQPVDRHLLAALFENALHGGDIRVVAVEIHDIIIKM